MKMKLTAHELNERTGNDTTLFLEKFLAKNQIECAELFLLKK